MTPKNIHKRFIPKRIFIFLKTPKNIEIQNIEPKKISPSLRTYENIRVPPPPTHTHIGFECLTLLKIDVIEYEKKGLQNGLKRILRDIDFQKNSRGRSPPPPSYERGVPPPSHTLPPLTASAARFKPSASSAPPPPPPPPVKKPLGPALCFMCFM